jgi:hypothetical protein
MDAPPKAALAPVPAIIGAILCVALIRSGFLGFLFLLPLGVLAYCYNPRTGWFGAALAALGNGAVSLGFIIFLRYNPVEMGWDLFYFTVMVLTFIWICVPPAGGPRLLRLPGAYRLAAGSAAGALALAPMVLSSRSDAGFYAFIRAQAETLASLSAASSGADVVQRSLLEQYVTPDAVLETLVFVALRGGAVVSCLLVFFMNRQGAALITWFARHTRPGASIIQFHAARKLIWVLSFSLLAILVGLWVKTSFLEIAAWNILVVCGILYLAQGGGILLYLLTRQSVPPFFRFFLNLLLVVVLLSPGINVIAMGVLILLGIAENWVPFRASRSNGSPPTPGA